MNDDAPMLGEEEIEAAPVDMDALGTIGRNGKRWMEIRDRLAILMEEAEGLQKEQRHIEESVLPQALQSINMKNFTLDNGFEVNLKRDYFAAIPKDETLAQEAFQFLRDNEAADLIKRKLAIAFGRNEDERAQALADYLAKTFPDHEPEDATSVHSATLKVWVRERMEAGLETPKDLFGVFIRDYVKITPPKAPRAKKAKA